MDDYEENVKYLAKEDTRISLGYSEFCEGEEEVDIQRFEDIDEIDFLYEDESLYINSIID